MRPEMTKYYVLCCNHGMSRALYDNFEEVDAICNADPDKYSYFEFPGLGQWTDLHCGDCD